MQIIKRRGGRPARHSGAAKPSSQNRIKVLKYRFCDASIGETARADLQPAERR
jgi:hypothetical protein